MRAVMTPPAVSIPRDRGETSRRSTSFVASLASPLRMPPWTAAPYATASSLSVSVDRTREEKDIMSV